MGLRLGQRRLPLSLPDLRAAGEPRAAYLPRAKARAREQEVPGGVGASARGAAGAQGGT